MSPPLRIGNAERERAQAVLGEHYVAGRLDHDEFSQRLDQVWAARTHADLLPVFADLPGPATRHAEPRAARRPRPGLPTPLLVAFVVVATVVIATNLPLILVAAGVWFFFLRDGCGGLRGRWPGSPRPT